MSRLQSTALCLTLAVIATACTQQGRSPQGPGQPGTVPAAAPADLIPYRLSGGSGSASFTARGKDDSCSGTLKFDDNVIYVDVKANGDVDPGHLAFATLTGTSACKGKPFELPEAFELKTGSIKSGVIHDVTGTPPDSAIFGSFKMTGTVCDATIHLGRWIASSDGGRVQIDTVNITHVKQTLHCDD
ncbi:MAG TPA: hypothetical protein VK760_12040 [Candidatus Acidoferrales bacterium]|nr:hypothetical protein [Candidatus Acidoferrales bacterium]